MTRWAIAGLVAVLVPALLLVAPASGDGVGSAAAAIVAVLALASVVALYTCANAFGSSDPSVLAGPSAEDRHRRGAFRRQHAPGVPGRPERPRAPGFALAG